MQKDHGLKKMAQRACVLALGVLGAVRIAHGQVPEVARSASPVSWHIDGGYSVMTGQAHNYLDNGYIVSGGLTWRPQPDLPFALRLDGHYSSYDASNHLLDLGEQQTQTRIDDGKGSTLGLDLNAVSYLPINNYASIYLTGGVGVDRRRIDLTQTILFGNYFCDYWYGFCDFGVFPGDQVVARTSTTRFAWNAGIGMEFQGGSWGPWFIEATYHRINTNPGTAYVPIKVGLRF